MIVPGFLQMLKGQSFDRPFNYRVVLRSRFNLSARSLNERGNTVQFGSKTPSETSIVVYDKCSEHVGDEWCHHY